MSPRLLIALSPFGLAVLIGLAVPNVDEPQSEPRGPMNDFSMSRYLWDDRPIIIFSPSVADPRYQESAKVLGRNRGPLLDRDIVVIEAIHPGPSSAEGRAIPPEAAIELRGRFGVEPETFAIVLVGKDGTEKQRWEGLPPLREIYALIDSMAMRRSELQERAGDGGGD